MLKRLASVCLFILFVFNQNIHAQFVFRHLDVVDGLSDNQIRGLSQAPDGRIGVKTASILNLYNGASFQQFYQDNKRKYLWNYFKTPREYYDAEGRVWMKEQDHLLLLDLKTNKFVYNIDSVLRNYGVKRRLVNLFIDDSKNFWFVTDDNSCLFYNISEKKLIKITDGKSAFTRKYGIPREMAQYKNFHWIIYSNGTICCWDHSSKEFVSQDNRFYSEINATADRIYINMADKNRVKISTTPNGDLWLMLTHGVYFYNRITTEWKAVTSISGLSNFFTCMDIDRDGNAWIGTSQSGLRFVEHGTFRITEIPGLKIDGGGTVYNDIFSVFVDKNNGLWVGTLFQGLYYYHPCMKKFLVRHVADGDSDLTNEIIRCFLEDKDGSILIGSGLGLFRYFPQTGKSEQILKSEIGKGLCLSLFRDRKGRVWVGTYFNGFYCIDGSRVKSYKDESFNLNSFPNPNNARAMYQDSEGRYWASVMGGIGEFDVETGKIRFLSEKHPEIKNYKICYAFYAKDKDTFVSVGESGIYYYNTKTDKVTIPKSDPFSQEGGIKYNCYFRDSRGLVWLGTENGLRILDSANKAGRYTIDIHNGLTNGFISSIEEDGSGVIWVAKASGLTKIAVSKKQGSYHFSLVNFDELDGLQPGKFNTGASLKARDGTLYFGGVHGFNSFIPQKIKYNFSQDKPVFTSLYLYNTLVTEGEEYKGHLVLTAPIGNTPVVKLNHKENFISVDFSGLNYVNPSRTYYRYKLENYDKDWMEIQANGVGRATYTGLKPGEYKLVVYAANNDKIWSAQPAELTIIIRPPFWATVYAYVFYFVLLLSGTFYLYRRLKDKNLRKQQEQESLNQRVRKEELDQMKFRFFTNISHEFKTPLTLILMPLESMINRETDDLQRSKLSAIHRNAKGLLELVNQLLDFRKLEMQGEEISLKHINVSDFFRGVYLQFKDSMNEKHIDFVMHLEVNSLIMSFDESKIHKVVNNILLNSLKFTPAEGLIELMVGIAYSGNREFLEVIVSDSGPGIAGEDMDNIFSRFYQGKANGKDSAGSGIGLHLAKEYVLMHKGEISANNNSKGGASFKMLIPTDLEELEDEVIPENEYVCESNDRKTVLLIEDNHEFRKFLSEQLHTYFHVIEAVDGEAGEKMALKEMPDLIVSDIMMPKVDGITLCIRLKKNIQTSHIPFILLTARNSDEAMIEGYNAGADSYISKPFNLDVLLARIKKLLEQQESRQELFRKNIDVSPSSITITSLDEELIQKAIEQVEKNMDSADYSVEDLSRDLGLSRTHLYRKLQSITGKSPLEFIRTIRMKRAAQYLRDSQYNISEIADIVGFNTLKYFNKYFKEEFGMVPTQYRAENKPDNA